MIFLVTNQTSLVSGDTLYTLASVQDVLDYFKNHDAVALDTETTGFDPHTTKVISLQLGDRDNQFVIDTLTVNILLFKELIETRIIIGQNLKFDLKFLYVAGIFPMKIWDTMVTEKVLYSGYTTVRNGLDYIVERRLGIKMDKTIRKDIAKEGLTTRVIQYAAGDVVHLHEIKRQQEIDLKEKGLEKVVYIENRFTPVLAYIEYCGFKLDSEKWKEKMKIDLEKQETAKENLNNYILTKGLDKFIQKQLDLFEPVRCSVSWASPKQVVEVFEHLNIPCSYYDKGVMKKSVEASVIEKYRKEHILVDLYLTYKKTEKVVSTYGDSFLKQINPKTGRIHTNFKQIMDTGRISSGGKDKIQKSEYINFQNIPSDKLTRSCFVAEKGHSLIICDYGGQEQIVLANKSLDENILKFYDEKMYDGDMHTFVTTRIWKELDGLSLAEIKKDHSDKRSKAKTAGFAINYGGVGQTIANNMNLTKQEGDEIYDAYFKAFPGLKSYFDKVKKQGLKDGYILISEQTGRKCYIEFFDKYRELEDQVMAPGFWEEYRYQKTTNSKQFSETKQIVSDYFYYKGTIERMSLNYPIQGSSAEITKISCVLIYEYIVKNNLLNKVRFVNTIHDENVLEVPNDLVDDLKTVVEYSMKTAADLYCKRVPLKAEAEINPFWKK